MSVGLGGLFLVLPLLVALAFSSAQSGNSESHVSKAVLNLCKPHHSVCAEVGVWKGEFTREIVERKSKALYLIDPWAYQAEKYPGRWFSGKVAKSQNDMDEIADSVERKYGRFNYLPEVHIVRNFSEHAFSTIEDNFFDWVYIDGNHEYEPALQDLRDSWRTTKTGGHVTGDDYLWTNGSGTFTVKLAVETFARERGLQPPALHEVGGWQFVFKKVKGHDGAPAQRRRRRRY
jgi:hypothetical protein